MFPAGTILSEDAPVFRVFEARYFDWGLGLKIGYGTFSAFPAPG
jgi:hypothetical protein